MNSALLQNCLVSILVTTITFTIAFLLKYLNQNKLIGREVSRKVVHIGAGTLYLSIYFYNDKGFYSKYLNIFANILWTILIVWKANSTSTSSNLDELVVGTMSRTRKQNELLRGPLFFNIVTMVCGTIFYRTDLGSIMMAILTWGDGLAAVIGTRFGPRIIYRNKTLNGCVTMFIASFLSSLIYVYSLVNYPEITVIKLLIICFVSTFVEALSPSDFDNITIPFSVLVIYYLI